MRKNSIISNIIPSFNRAKFIEQTIVSVRDQSFACGKLLVIDDRSAKIPVRYPYQENKRASAAHAAIRALPRPGTISSVFLSPMIAGPRVSWKLGAVSAIS